MSKSLKNDNLGRAKSKTQIKAQSQPPVNPFIQQLPAFYRRFLPVEVANLQIVETKATCNNCIMTRPQNKNKRHYLPDLKCCTFQPFIPNYVVGALLQDPSITDTAKQVFRDKIQRREYALPVGMVAPVRYQLEFMSRKKTDFGQSESLLCSYYDTGSNNCSIWAYRGVVCTTFFCKSSYGSAGQQLWKSISNYLSYLEMGLMEEALVQLDFSPRQVIELLDFLNRSDGTIKEQTSWVLERKKSERLWNFYFDEQEDFYKKCFHIINTMKVKDITELLGDTGEQLLQQVLQQSQAVLKG
ncbi:MAG: hypothetical protein ACOYOK_12025 [Pseudobdellovibrionaceae bacterium]